MRRRAVERYYITSPTIYYTRADKRLSSFFSPGKPVSCKFTFPTDAAYDRRRRSFVRAVERDDDLILRRRRNVERDSVERESTVQTYTSAVTLLRGYNC